MNPQPPTVIRPYRSGDESAMVDLFWQSHGRLTSPAHWTWKLRHDVDEKNAWIAASGRQALAHYGGIPTPFRCSQRLTRTMVSVDAMTAPAHRRRGLLTQLVGMAHAEWQRQGVEFTLGLPNEQWGSRSQALGWQPLFPLRWMIRPLRLERLLARRLGLPILGRARVIGTMWNRLQPALQRDESVRTQLVVEAGPVFDHLWQECRSNWVYSRVRDRDWVNWRFLSSPSRTYHVMLASRFDKPTGYLAYHVDGEHGNLSARLAELFCAPNDHATRDVLMGALLESLVGPGDVHSLATLAIPGTRHFKWLRRCGFLMGQQFWVNMVPLADREPAAAMRDPANWNLSGADFDVI